MNDDAATRVNRGFASVATGHWQEARTDASVALDQISQGQETAHLRAQAHEILAYSNAKLQQHELAVEHVDQAIAAVAGAKVISGSWVQRLTHFVDMVNEVRRERGTSLDIVVYPALHPMTEGMAWLETGNLPRAQGLLEKSVALHHGDSWFIESMMAKSAGQMGITERAHEKHLFAITLRDSRTRPGNRTEIVRAVNKCPLPESHSTIYGPHPWSACPAEQVMGAYTEDRAEAIVGIYQEAKQREAATPIPSPTAIPTPFPTSTPTPQPTPIPTATPPVPTPTPTPTPTLRPPTATPTVTPTPTPRPTSTPTPTPTRPPWTVPLDVALIEHWVIVFTNSERERHDLQPLEHDPRISEIARFHSGNMVAQDIFAHDLDGKDPTDRALDAGYDCRADLGGGRYTFGLAENIAKNYRVKGWSGISHGYGWVWTPKAYYPDERAAAKSLVDQWMGSPGHRANILNGQYRRIGVGVATGWEESSRGNRSEAFWATQNFSSCR